MEFCEAFEFCVAEHLHIFIKKYHTEKRFPWSFSNQLIDDLSDSIIKMQSIVEDICSISMDSNYQIIPFFFYDNWAPTLAWRCGNFISYFTLTDFPLSFHPKHFHSSILLYPIDSNFTWIPVYICFISLWLVTIV